jgi:ADP-heptose:LPS heptosyltransferase
MKLPRSGGRCVAFSPLNRHAAAQLGEVGFMAGLDVDPAAPRLHFSPALSQQARTLLQQLCKTSGRPLITLLPARTPRYRGDLERLWQVGRGVAQRMGGTVVQLGGPYQQNGPRIERSGPAAPLAAALLGLAAVCLSDDIGWCHVAAACDAPVVAAFGRNDPHRHGPVSARAAVLWAEAADCGGCDQQQGIRCVRCVPTDKWVETAEQLAAAHWPRDRLRGLGVSH